MRSRVGLALAAVLAFAVGPAVAAPGGSAVPRESHGRAGFSDLATGVERVVREASPYLVRVIRVTELPAGASGRSGRSRIIGSGVSLGGGRILTCAGVVGPARDVLVTAAAGDTLPAKVLGVDRRTNLAVLESSGLSLPAIPMAEDELLFPGDLVVAMGMGAPGTPTASFGSVVLVEGPNLGYSDVEMVQVSAPVYPGITGGALLNGEGKMVGLISGRMELEPGRAVVPAGTDMVAGFLYQGRISTATPTAATVALPVGHAMDTAGELERLGYVERGYLGVQVELSESSHPRGRELRGVIVHRLVEGGPAAAAGLLPGDVILDYAGARVQSPEDLSFLVAATVPGSHIPVRFLRRGMRSAVYVDVEQAPGLPWTPEMDASLVGRNGSGGGVAPTVR
jgi:serine protease Do